MAAVTNTNSATVKYSVNIAGKTFTVPDGAYSGPFVQEIEAVIAAGASNTLFTIAVDVSKIQLVVMSSDQALTVKVNSTATPTPEIALSSTAGLLWAADFPTTNDLNVDITALYVSNAGATDAKFHFGVICSA